MQLNDFKKDVAKDSFLSLLNYSWFVLCMLYIYTYAIIYTQYSYIQYNYSYTIQTNYNLIDKNEPLATSFFKIVELHMTLTV